MTVPAPDLRKLTDDQIWDEMHRGQVDSDLHKQCVLILQMRNAERQTKAAADMAAATEKLAQFTSGLVRATWVLAGLTCVLAALALLELIKG